MFRTFYEVTFIYFLGLGLLVLLLNLIDLVFSSNYYGFFFFSVQGLRFTSLFGTFAVAWSIREGQFISDIKSSHWSQKKD